MNKQTQCDRIVTHMNTYGKITSLEAMNEYGIMRLASRIHDLKVQGYMIKKNMEHAKNRYGDKVSYCSYELMSEEDFV